MTQAADRPARRARAKRRYVLAGVAALVAIPGFLYFLTQFGGESSGQLSVQRPGGEYVVDGAICDRLAPHFGVRLGDEGRAFVTSDVDGAITVRITPPGCAAPSECEAQLVTPGACSTYDVALEGGAYQVNHRNVIDGHVRLSCALESGARIEGAIEFDGCQ